MNLLEAGLLYTCNDHFDILPNRAIAFDNRIREIGTLGDLKRKYPDAEICSHPDKILIPGFINPHVHLEFSANVTELAYGSFIGWLQSVMKNREHLVDLCEEECIERVLESMLLNGTTAIGAISSFGHDYNPCLRSPMKTVLFIEAIGSNPAMLDSLLQGIKDRLEQAEKEETDRFIPGLSVHSPFSIHPVLTREVLKLAKEKGLPVAAHFMESQEERTWLDDQSGPFFDFFKELFGIENPTPLFSAKSFLDQFEGIHTLYVHGVFADKNELESMAMQNASFIHCPRSNRLLSGQLPEINTVLESGINFTVATDGLSSNYTLSPLDEIRHALFMHEGSELESLAKTLLSGITRNAAKALQLESGSLEPGKNADFLLFDTPRGLEECSNKATQFILHAGKPASIYLDGERL